MLDIRPYLIYPDDTKNVRFGTLIERVNENRFHLPRQGETVYHWVLKIYVENFAFDEPDPVDRVWHINDQVTPLEFRMITRKKITPTIEEFSQHIYTECRAALMAINGGLFKWPSDLKVYAWDHIDPTEVYDYMKSIGVTAHRTEQFLDVYEHYKLRMYHTLKWVSKISLGMVGMFMSPWEYPMQDHVLAFLDMCHNYRHYTVE